MYVTNDLVLDSTDDQSLLTSAQLMKNGSPKIGLSLGSWDSQLRGFGDFTPQLRNFKIPKIISTHAINIIKKWL